MANASNDDESGDASADDGPNPAQLSIIRQGVKVWNAWRERHPDTAVNLHGADLEGANLQGANLGMADLSGAHLYEADLSRAHLVMANLAGAHLGGTNLSGTHSVRVNLSGAILRAANLSGASLQEADLSGAALDGTNSSGVNLIDANLVGASFYRADLSGAHLARANLSRARLRDANLSGATLLQANLSEAVLVGTNVTSVNFTRANLTNCDITAVGFSRNAMRGKLRGVRGIESAYGNAIFKRAVADQDFLDSLEEHWKGSWRIWLFRAWGTIDYGRSLGRTMLVAAALIAFFGMIYTIWPALVGLDCTPETPTYHFVLPVNGDVTSSIKSPSDGCRHDGFTPFYFSIVTFTTLGFGDIAARSVAGELVISLEVLLGYLTLGLMLSVLAEKIARRS